MNKTIVFTGGGSAGHVTVNLALIPKFVEMGWEVLYIGSEQGIERQLVSTIPNIEYYSIASGKLRRYLDWNNIKDPFKVIKGVFQARKLIKRLKPNVVFSKGGFVSVPVVMGSWLNKVPAVIHESDMTPGLANKLSIPFVQKVCVTFKETLQHLRTRKAVYVGAIVREELYEGNAVRGLLFCKFTKDKPVLLIMGGSLGSQRINQVVRANLSALLNDFQIVHLCGKGQVDPAVGTRGYIQYEYITDELPDMLAMCDLVISRAGSNSIFEFLALRKPMLLIPLTRNASRGDQILNAQSFGKSGFAGVLLEEDLTQESFLEGIYKVFENKEEYKTNMARHEGEHAADKVVELILQVAKM
ncbi:MAG TPA: undecaprenyldiphospho-muramoylpentapeptide beta-N-acetylglucosaminyltransferase [Bacilli bacterium]